MKKFICRVMVVVKNQGLQSTLKNLGSYAQWRYRKFREYQYDKKNNITTLQTDSSYFDSVQSTNTEFAVPYEPVQFHVFRDMLKHVSVDFSDYTFIDLGSGKGRALLFASDYHFKNIIGVEFSKELHEIADRNVNNFLQVTGKNNMFSLLCMDVVDYELPNNNLVIFLYNPFFGKVMNSIIQKLTDFLQQGKFELIILYRNPQCADLFDNHKLLDRVHTTNSYSIYRKKLEH